MRDIIFLRSYDYILKYVFTLQRLWINFSIDGVYNNQSHNNQMDNKINRDCIIHKKICDLFCTYSKCVNKILCQKCIQDHLQVHPRQFIYSMQNLCQIHSFDKVSKMKQILGKYKIMNEQRIVKMYNPFEVILNPLIQRMKQFQKQSKDMIVRQLLLYLSKNKSIIQGTKINKSDTNAIKTKPQLMVEQTIAQVELINQKQAQLKQNTQSYTWYADATEQLCTQAKTQITKMVNVAIKLLDNYTKIQIGKYTDAGVGMDDHHQESFYKRYINSHQVALKGERNNMEMTLIQSKKEMQRKEQEIKRARNQIKEKVTKIQELNIKIDGLKEQLLQWEQKLEREERQRKQAAGREKKKLQEFLIKSDVISDGGHSINLQKKVLQEKYLSLILQLVPNPIQLQLSQHNLNKDQLKLFYKCSSLQVLRMSFMPCDKQFLAEALKYYQNIHTLQINSANIDDDILMDISVHFPLKLKHLHLIDNKIGDDGLDYMFKNMKCTLESLFVSYNNLNPRAIEIISRFCYDIKTLHISKNDIKNKGAVTIGKNLKNVQELFIGGTGIQKEGFLNICRNCLKLKRLSLVATQVSIEIISQILLNLQKLEWLDISYAGMSKADLQKVEKLKIFNKTVQIIAQM